MQIKSSGDSAQILNWHSLALARGTYGSEDCVNEVTEIKLDRPVPLKVGRCCSFPSRNRCPSFTQCFVLIYLLFYWAALCSTKKLTRNCNSWRICSYPVITKSVGKNDVAYDISHKSEHFHASKSRAICSKSYWEPCLVFFNAFLSSRLCLLSCILLRQHQICWSSQSRSQSFKITNVTFLSRRHVKFCKLIKKRRMCGVVFVWNLILFHFRIFTPNQMRYILCSYVKIV